MNKRFFSTLTLLVALCLWAWTGVRPAHAADFQVATCDNAGLLVAYNAAVAAGAGTHNVLFDANCAGQTINVTSGGNVALPALNNAAITIVIDGGGNVTLNGGAGVTNYRLAEVSNGTIELRGLIIQNFRRGQSGGAFRVNGSATAFGIITNSSFLNNTANGATIDSGAVHITTNGGGLTISNSYFSGNSAGRSGGAVTFGQGTTGSIRNSTFVNNTAVTNAGAINVLATTNVTINNVTTNGNTAPTGNAIRLNVNTANVTVRNSIFSEATPCSIIAGATFNGADNNYATAASCTGFTVDATADDFGAPTNGGGLHTTVLPPLFSNIAVNSIVGLGTCEATDQRGVSRAGQDCDAGAMEAFTPTAVTMNAIQTGTTAVPVALILAVILFGLLGLGTAVRLRQP